MKRIPVFGLGCVAGAAGIARLHDYLVGHPDEVAVLLSVELCSLTIQRDDASTAEPGGQSGLFGDGAAAVVMVGERRAQALGLAGPQVVATRSPPLPGHRAGDGLGHRRLAASASCSPPTVADVVETYLGQDLKEFLAAHASSWPTSGAGSRHPGGPKVLEAMQRALALPDGALDLTWRSLAAVGNLSSGLRPARRCADTLAPQRRCRAGSPRRCCWRWDLASAPSSCCCGGSPMSSAGWYTLLVVAVGVERLAELGVS